MRGAARRSPRCRCRGRGGSRPAARSARSALRVDRRQRGREVGRLEHLAAPAAAAASPCRRAPPARCRCTARWCRRAGRDRRARSSRAGSSTGAAFDSGTVDREMRAAADVRFDLDRRGRARARCARRSTGRGRAARDPGALVEPVEFLEDRRAACDCGMPTPVS